MSDTIPITDLILDELDAVPGLDQPRNLHPVVGKSLYALAIGRRRGKLSADCRGGHAARGDDFPFRWLGRGRWLLRPGECQAGGTGGDRGAALDQEH